MRFRLRVPARINVLGNPADANEGDFATISVAIDVYAHAIVEPAEGIALEMLHQTGSALETVGRQSFDRDTIPLPYDGGDFDLVKAAINRLHRYSAQFRGVLAQSGVRICTWTGVPRQAGLGGSSLFVLLTLAGLRVLFDLDPLLHNDYVLGEVAQRAEGKELGITCGFADRYVPTFGGIAYLDYRGKLHHREIRHEPYVTYERLDPWVDDLPLVAITTGVPRDSGDVHGRMRPLYLEEHAVWKDSGGKMPPMVRFMSGAWEMAWRGKMALLEQDWPTFGALMNRNHRLVDEMMAYCGFADGAGRVNNHFIEIALSNGALGAKLTGAGGGGSVFALTHPGEEKALLEIWQREAVEAGLDSARIFRPHISWEGLVIETK